MTKVKKYSPETRERAVRLVFEQEGDHASDLKGVPLKTLQELGGWKTHQTILVCYQQVDEGEMREALENRRTGT